MVLPPPALPGSVRRPKLLDRDLWGFDDVSDLLDSHEAERRGPFLHLRLLVGRGVGAQRLAEAVLLEEES